MIVNDAEPALHIYRDIIGLKVRYDSEFDIQGVDLPAGVPNQANHVRLIILSPEHNESMGMLGILVYLHPKLTTQDKISNKPRRLTVGDSVYVYLVQNLEEVTDKLKQISGVEIISDITEQEYPTTSPQTPNKSIKLKGITFFDPNGYFVECNQWIEN